MIQLTLIQIDNYGPWTTTPEPKREADLQILQSSIYRDIQQQFSSKKALAFWTRGDNMFAATNGLSLEDHRRIIDSLNRRYPVTVSMAIAAAKTPIEAQKKASEALSEAGSAKNAGRVGVLKEAGLTKDKVQIAHFDINNITERTDTDVYDSYREVTETLLELVRQLEKKNAMVFFMAGDNYISVCNGLAKKDIEDVLQIVEEKAGVKLKAGVGLADSAEEATQLASMGLKEIRSGKAREHVVFKQG